MERKNNKTTEQPRGEGEKSLAIININVPQAEIMILFPIV